MNFLEELKASLDNRDKIYNLIRQHPIDTIENLFLLPSPNDDSKRVRITLNRAQKQLITYALQSKDIFALGSTQIAGKTTAAALLAAYVIIAYPGIQVYYLSLKDELAMDFQSRVLKIIDSCVPVLRPNYKRQINQNKVVLFDNTSVLRVSGINKHYKDPNYLFKQLTVHILIMDEFANIKQNARMLELATTRLAASRSMLKGVYPSSLILLSNAVALTSEESRFAFKLWYDTTRNETAYSPILFYYRDLIPEQEAERYIYEEYKRTRNKRQILINYECMFLPDNDSFIDDDDILNQLIQNKSTVYQYFIEDENGEPIVMLNAYKDINLYRFSNSIYIGVDVATAYGRDSYAIVGVDPSNASIVFDWYGQNVDVTVIIKILLEMAKHFKNSVIVIERNLGSHIIEILSQFIPDKIYIDRSSDGKPGVYTSQKTKDKMYSILYNVVSQTPEAITSKHVAIQILSLKKRKNKIVCDLEHDDLLMAYNVALYAIYNDNLLQNVTEDNGISQDEEKNMLYKLLGYQTGIASQSEEQLLDNLMLIANKVNDKDMLISIYGFLDKFKSQ